MPPHLKRPWSAVLPSDRLQNDFWLPIRSRTHGEPDVAFSRIRFVGVVASSNSPYPVSTSLYLFAPQNGQKLIRIADLPSSQSTLST